MMRFVLPVALVCALGAGVMWIQGQWGEQTERSNVAPVDDADRELQQTLKRLAAAWNPRKKRRVIAGAKERLNVIQAPLLRILDRPRHPKLGVAMYLCAQLEIAESRPLLKELVEQAPRAMRSEAVMAAGTVEAWTDDELRALFNDADLGVRIAGLWCWGRNPTLGLLDDVLAILESQDPDLRTAALEALPSDIPEESRQAMRESLQQATGPTRIALLSALGRVGVDEDTEVLLTQCLWDENPEVREAALRSLRQKTSPLREARAVIELIGGDVSQIEAAQALYCLERTRSISAIDIRNRVGFVQGPLARYFAARCLLLCGEKQGAQHLISLLSVEQSALPKTTSVDALVAMARELLSSISGLPRMTPAAKWSDWALATTHVSARALPALTAKQLGILGLKL